MKIVMLIQNNLALAFGLAAGIGHLGIAAVMAFLFCFTNVLLWHSDYGQNPMDNERIAKKRAEFEASASYFSQQLP